MGRRRVRTSHDQAKPLNVLRGIHRAPQPDGVYLMQDINGTSHLQKDIEHPLGTLLYTVSCMHCMTVSLAQGGEGLGAMWDEEKTREYLQKAGFRAIETHLSSSSPYGGQRRPQGTRAWRLMGQVSGTCGSAYNVA